MIEFTVAGDPSCPERFEQPTRAQHQWLRRLETAVSESVRGRGMFGEDRALKVEIDLRTTPKTPEQLSEGLDAQVYDVQSDPMLVVQSVLDACTNVLWLGRGQVVQLSVTSVLARKEQACTRVRVFTVPNINWDAVHKALKESAK